MPSVEHLVEIARTLVRNAPYGLVVTAETSGPPTGRLVQHLEVTTDLTVAFSTSPRSRKADRIASTGMMTYLVEDRARFAYVSLSGPARLIDDRAERVRLWEEGLRAFFPDGPEGDDFVLVSLSTERVELWSAVDEIHPEPYGLVPAVVVRHGNGWREVQPERR